MCCDINMVILDTNTIDGKQLRDVMINGDGYCLLTNHGIGNDMISSAFHAAKMYHSLPLESKMIMKHKGDFIGYQPMDAHINHAIGRVDDEKLLPNRNESVFFKRIDNIWPENMPEFREIIESMANALEQLSQRMVIAYSDMLGVSLAQYFPKPLYYTLRLTRYPQMIERDPGQYGLAGHRDTSFFTLLCQDGIQGLSVRNRLGQWHDVPGDTDKIVLVSGLQAHNATYKEIVAAPHRVVGKLERYAMPFFVMAENLTSL